MTATTAEDWSKIKRKKVAELRKLCEEAGLDASGTKPQLLLKLSEHFEIAKSGESEEEEDGNSSSATMETDADEQETLSSKGTRGRTARRAARNTADSAEVEEDAVDTKKSGSRSRGRTPTPKKTPAKSRSRSNTRALSKNRASPSGRLGTSEANGHSADSKLSPSNEKEAKKITASHSKSPARVPVSTNGDKTDNNSADQNETSSSKTNKDSKKSRRKKKNKKIERNTLASILGSEQQTLASPPPATPDDVEVEYVPVSVEQMGLSAGAPEFQEFSKIFAKFTLPTSDDENQESAEAEEDKVEKTEKDAKTKEELLQEFFADSDEEMGEEEGQDEEEEKLNKRKLRKLKRISIAQLKQMVEHPEAVEWVDVTAADPLTLVHLKSYRNTVPVPLHWSAKRKYLQGKRGIEKPPFELPEYIRDTGITQMRQAIAEKEENMSMKQKMRAKMQPKMGKLEIDYQKLHDAFFRFQTKPHLTVHGELYREGKEFQTKTKEKRPGVLSAELREALGMQSELVPPPWLLAQQRFGPPPNYPNLRIPGLNAPIPEGAQWGFHPGGWGKPPVDEFGRPLYGDVFGMYQQYQQQLQAAIMTANLAVPIERELWGELIPVEEVEEEEEPESGEGEQSEEEPEPTPVEIEEGKRTQITTIDIQGMATPSGLASVAGMKTPQVIELRKEKPSQPTELSKQQKLYEVLEQKESKIRGMMGSQHTYDLTDKKKRKFGETPEESIGAIDESKFSLEREESSAAALGKSNGEVDKQAKKRKTEEKRRLQDFKF